MLKRTPITTDTERFLKSELLKLLKQEERIRRKLENNAEAQKSLRSRIWEVYNGKPVCFTIDNEIQVYTIVQAVTQVRNYLMFDYRYSGNTLRDAVSLLKPALEQYVIENRISMRIPSEATVYQSISSKTARNKSIITLVLNYFDEKAVILEGF